VNNEEINYGILAIKKPYFGYRTASQNRVLTIFGVVDWSSLIDDLTKFFFHQFVMVVTIKF
jgi:hypothetical protein